MAKDRYELKTASKDKYEYFYQPISSASTSTYTAGNSRAALWNKLNRLALQAPSGQAVLDECLAIAEVLIEKNIAYGDSALNPIQIFSRTSNAEQIRVRIDDKLNRLKNGGEYHGDDTVFDLIGYLILYRIASRDANDNEETEQQGPSLVEPSDEGSVTERDEPEARGCNCPGW